MKKTKARPYLWIAIPLMDELENLAKLISDIQAQTFRHFEVFVCVNQPDHWWDDPEKLSVCNNNVESLNYLATHSDFHVIDRCSKGKGWKGKNFGVGWARKCVMDACNEKATEGDIILSLDGDTRFSPGYFSSVAGNLARHPRHVALSLPYYHPLTGDEPADRAILRYEVYMRYFVLNLWRIESPYTFSALGSALALPVWAYRAIGGLTPVKSGEDFYFLQKLRKYGELIYWNEEKVYPASRFSSRVFFGTGPAMIRFAADDYSSYPIYDYRYFNLIRETYQLFPALFQESVATPMDGFLKEIFNEEDIWQALRLNNPECKRFIGACHEKVDGLRLLQFLKSRHQAAESTDEQRLQAFIRHYYPEKEGSLDFPFKVTTFAEATIASLNEMRDFLMDAGEQYQLKHFSCT